MKSRRSDPPLLVEHPSTHEAHFSKSEHSLCFDCFCFESGSIHDASEARPRLTRISCARLSAMNKFSEWKYLSYLCRLLQKPLYAQFAKDFAASNSNSFCTVRNHAPDAGSVRDQRRFAISQRLLRSYCDIHRATGIDRTQRTHPLRPLLLATFIAASLRRPLPQNCSIEP